MATTKNYNHVATFRQLRHGSPNPGWDAEEERAFAEKYGLTLVLFRHGPYVDWSVCQQYRRHPDENVRDFWQHSDGRWFACSYNNKAWPVTGELPPALQQL
jgi:hypothetical protein